MNLIRKYKISKLLNQPLEGVEGEIISLIKYWLTDLIPFKMDEYPDSIYYMKQDGRYVLEQNNDSDYIHIRWKEFWEVLECKYKIEYSDVQDILNYMIEEAFKTKVGLPFRMIGFKYGKIEEAFKTKVGLPRVVSSSNGFKIEEAFKTKVGLPVLAGGTSFRLIEKTFKKKVKTPMNHFRNTLNWIEETFKKQNIK